jgi:urea transport system substrate-binding protein
VSIELGTLSHYRLLRLLGEGGMGKVYQAQDLRLQRTVALKVMLPELIPQLPARERFLREARTMAALRHDHVVTIYEVDQADDVPFLAMEFLHGQTLEAWLKAGAVPRVADVLRIGREIADGLAAAQERGLIHRDIKPANLWLEAPTGRVKILDFGLARPSERRSGLTRTGDVVGTPHFMAPEQARGEHVDGRSDLFSLGVVLYLLCTGQLPFRGNSVTAVLTALAVDSPVPVQELNADIPAALADLVMRLLEKDPARRPQSGGKVVAALREIEGQAPPASRAFLPRGSASPSAAAPTVAPNAWSNTPADPVRGPSIVRAATRWRWGIAAGVLACLVLGGRIAWLAMSPRAVPCVPSAVAAAPPAGPPIRIGVLYSRTGTMAVSERPILDGVLLAVGEINDQGGILGRPLEPVIADGQSDEAVFASEAARLIEREKVSTLVGCWTSSSRKAVKAVVEGHDHLLLYPVSYEGMEQSTNVVYGGSVPNQQILPALRWCFGFLNKKRWFLVGTDSIFPHAAHAVISDEAESLGSQIVGEEFLPPGSTELAGVAERIAGARPDLVINTIYGDTNVAFFRALRRAGVAPPGAPTLSFTVSEEELSGLAPGEVIGHYASANYFQGIDLPQNQRFLRLVRSRYGPEKIVTDPMQTAYALVHLWAQALQAAGTDDVRAVRQAMKGQKYDSPQGPVTIDPETLHTVQVVRVGRINDRGRFEEAFVSPQPIPPTPFPDSRDRRTWQGLLDDLYRRWGGRWHNPGR